MVVGCDISAWTAAHFCHVMVSLSFWSLGLTKGKFLLVESLLH